MINNGIQDNMKPFFNVDSNPVKILSNTPNRFFMKKNLILLLISVIFALCSCGMGTQGKEYELVETKDSLSFELPNNVSVFNYTCQVFKDKDGKEFLVFQDHGSMQVLSYALKDQKLEKQITLAREGPNGLGRAIGVTVKDWNEIYIPSIGVKKLFMIDSTGTVKKKYDFTADDDVYYVNSSSWYPLVILGSKMYSFQTPQRNAATGGLKASPSEVCVDLSTMESSVSECLLPEAVLKETEGKVILPEELVTCSRVYNGHDFVYGYHYDDHLIVLDSLLKKKGDYKIASKYIGSVQIPDTSKELDMNGMWLIQCTNACFGELVHDPYRHLYYRFVYPETELDEKEPSWVDLVRSGRNVFSVQVIDEKFNLIGETLFPRNRFNSHIYIVSEDGFYISCNHYKNPGFTDDRLQFVRFDLEEVIH